MKANNSRIVKKANKFLVLEVIRKFSCVTVEGIVDSTNLSRPTVLNILKELTEESLVVKSGFAPAEIGRQPVLYSINTHGFFAIGIDVDDPPVHLAVSDLNGELVYSVDWQIDAGDTVDAIVQALVDQIRKAIEVTGIEVRKVLGIGLGLPAVMDINQNRTAIISRIKGWMDIPVARLIQEKTGIEVVVRNDAHLLGAAELSFIDSREDVLYIIHRSGIGMAIYLNGELYEGGFGNSGYIGHTVIRADGRQCDCGQLGCLETYCSKRSIVERYRETTGRSLAYIEIVREAETAEGAARTVLVEAGEAFGIGISNAIKHFDISTVIIGDLKIDEKHRFYQAIHDSVKRHTANYLITPPRILLGKLDEKHFGLGGCHFVLKRFFSDPKLKLHI